MDDLIQQTKLFPDFTAIHYVLFAKSGFTGALKEKASKQKNVMLIGIEDMFFDDAGVTQGAESSGPAVPKE